jgi:ABC-type polar amino acid transport system ATPase subunit
MKALAKEGTTMLVITHEMGFASEVADRLVVMDEGVLIEQGRPSDILNNPQHKQTQSLLDRYRTSGHSN